MDDKNVAYKLDRSYEHIQEYKLALETLDNVYRLVNELQLLGAVKESEHTLQNGDECVDCIRVLENISKAVAEIRNCVYFHSREAKMDHYKLIQSIVDGETPKKRGRKAREEGSD